MRNVITLSNMPKGLHNWLKQEAARQSSEKKRRVGIYEIAIQAVQDYKIKHGRITGKANAPSKLVAVEIFRKVLQPAEVKSHRICLPQSKGVFFGDVGDAISIRDGHGGPDCPAIVGSQYRLIMREWYARHKDIESGNGVIFEQIGGTTCIRVANS